MIILRQKLNSSILEIDGQIKNGVQAGKRSQNYYDTMNWDDASKNATKIGSFAGTKKSNGTIDYSIKNNKGWYNAGKQEGFNSGFSKGQNSVGILGGAKNTWNSLSKNQQLGVAAGGAALAIGGAALLARNRRKRKEAEEELERERRRR